MKTSLFALLAAATLVSPSRAAVPGGAPSFAARRPAATEPVLPIDPRILFAPGLTLCIGDGNSIHGYSAQQRYLDDLAKNADDPEAQILSALLTDPELIDEYKKDLDSWLGKNHGDQSGTDRLRNWSKAIDEFVSYYAYTGLRNFIRLGAISQWAAPRGRVLLADLHRRYQLSPAVAPDAAAADGDASVASPTQAPWGQQPAPQPALVWPVERAPNTAPRVLSVQKSGNRWRVNGKDAEILDESSPRPGLTEAVVVHPEDPDVVVKLYHSPGSLEAPERKETRVASLLPLSAAGAAPTLLEHGEAAVPGSGRVYFYVQKRLRGRKLRELTAWPASAVASLVERLKASSLLLALPAPAREWLLSHVVVEDAGEGAPRAYLLGVDAAPAELSRAEAAADLAGSYLAPERRE